MSSSHSIKNDIVLARNIMMLKVRTLLPATSIPKGIQELFELQCSEMPIVNEFGKYCGMFSEKCCMKILATLIDLSTSKTGAVLKAADLMVPRQDLFTLSPDHDVITAISSLVDKKYSNAPVINAVDQYLGVFSERTCMGFIVEAAYGGLPSAKVEGFIDTEGNRTIDSDIPVHEIAKVFSERPYGCLSVMKSGQLVGQISRFDLLRHSDILKAIMEYKLHDTKGELITSDSAALEYLRIFDTLPDHTVSAFADEQSRTIDPELNLFEIAQLFLESPFRRFPVVKEEQFAGQVKRRDVLRSAIQILNNNNEK